MMGYRKGSAGSEYGWIRSISPIAFETYIIDESAICFCVGIAQQWGVGVSSASGTTTLTYHLAYSNFAAVFTGNTSGDKSTSPVNMTNVGLFSCRIHVKDDARYYADSFNWFALGFQQWGYAQKPTSEYDFDWVYPIPFPTLVGAIMLTPQYEGQCRPHSINSFDRFSCSLRTDGTKPELNSNHVFAIGFQQWGYTGEQSNKITFALSYPKAVLGILVTTGDGIPQNPVDVTLSGATAVGYNSAGCKTYWLAYGIQQWGNKKGIIDLPVPYTSFYIPVAGYGNKSSSWCPTDSTVVVSVRSLAQLYVNSREGLEFYFLTVGVLSSGEV